MQKMGGAQAFPRERITSSVLSLRSNPAKDIVSRFTPSRQSRPQFFGGFGVIL